MSIVQDVSGCLRERAGASAVDQADLNAVLGETTSALEWIRTAHAERTLPLLRLPERRDDIEPCAHAADTFLRGASEVVVFGTGGSSLGAQTLAQFAGWRVAGQHQHRSDAPRPQFHFVDNLDPYTMARIVEGLDLKSTRFLVVSKSGNTPETVLQMLCALDALKRAGLDWNIEHHFLALTEPGDVETNAVRRLAQMHGIPVLDHDPGVGGRYSVLSNVGLLPALMFGLDAVAIREGAAGVLEPILQGLEPQLCAPALGAAVKIAANRNCGVAINVLMPYSDRLRVFANWFVQLWAESLGKGGGGTTPLAAVGPVDQHSQMQLFLDGPSDKLITVLTLGRAGEGPRIDQAYGADPLVGYLAGKPVGALVDCEQRATVETLLRNGRLTRVIHIESLDETAMGALLMHFMLETIITGHLLGVDPFDQPAVEESKILTREYLSQM
jgi:glucose-6-phosphate isomerase